MTCKDFGGPLGKTSKKNKPKMAYSRDLLKMARQQCGIIFWIEIAVILDWRLRLAIWFGMDFSIVGLVLLV